MQTRVIVIGGSKGKEALVMRKCPSWDDRCSSDNIGLIENKFLVLTSVVSKKQHPFGIEVDCVWVSVMVSKFVRL